MTATREPNTSVFVTDGKPTDKAGKMTRRILFSFGILLLTVMFVAPLRWMLSISFKSPNEATKLPLSWFPEKLDFTAYSQLTGFSSSTPVFRWFFNSLTAATASSLIIVTVDVLAAYALARMRFFGNTSFSAASSGPFFVPGFVFLIPNFLIVYNLGWLDSLLAVIMLGAGGAFGVFFLRQFFLGIPRELEEAAEIDGANQWTIFWQVVLPLAKPAISTLAVLSFLGNWNDCRWPVYVLFSRANMTLPAGLATLQGAGVSNYPLIMAGAVIASMPVLIHFILAQRQIVTSVARSGLKG